MYPSPEGIFATPFAPFYDPPSNIVLTIREAIAEHVIILLPGLITEVIQTLNEQGSSFIQLFGHSLDSPIPRTSRLRRWTLTVQYPASPGNAEMNGGIRGDLMVKIKISEAQERAGHGEKVTPSAFGGSKLYDYYFCFYLQLQWHFYPPSSLSRWPSTACPTWWPCRQQDLSLFFFFSQHVCLQTLHYDG